MFFTVTGDFQIQSFLIGFRFFANNLFLKFTFVGACLHMGRINKYMFWFDELFVCCLNQNFCSNKGLRIKAFSVPFVYGLKTHFECFFCWKKNHMDNRADNRAVSVLFLTGDHKIGGAGAKAKPDPPCSCRASAFFKTQTIRNKPFLIP